MTDNNDNNKITIDLSKGLDKHLKTWDELLDESKSVREEHILTLEDLGLVMPEDESDNTNGDSGVSETDLPSGSAADMEESSAINGNSTSYESRGIAENSPAAHSNMSSAAAPAAAASANSGLQVPGRSTKAKQKGHLFNKSANESNGDNNQMASNKINKKKKSKKKKSPVKKVLTVILILFLLCLVSGCALLGYVAITTPPIDPSNIYSQLAQTSVIYDDNGALIEYIDTNENRTYVTSDQIPKNLSNAVIAIEDKTFKTHHGFNFVRIAGAVVDSIKSGGKISGTSTITQQLARNLYLTKERSIIRKLREAYYTIQLEQQLTKDQIMEAYLNTVFFGFNSYGVQAASKSYFSKDVSELTLEECATLASIPKNPNKNSPLKRYPSEDISADNPYIVRRSEAYTIVYNEAFVDRQHQILNLMLEQGLITEAEHNAAFSIWMKNSMNPSEDSLVDISSYFTDYLKTEVLNDLQEELNIDETKASTMLYNGGLSIYSTVNIEMQQTAETEFDKNGNFPSVRNLKKEKNTGNILDSRGQIMLYSLESYFDPSGNFVISPSEYTIDADGNMTLLKNNRLNFYDTSSNDVKDCVIEFKNMYTIDNSIFYVINGGNINIDSKYKTKTENGDLLIDKSFFTDFPTFFNFNENGTYIDSTHYTLKQRVIQPQSAMVITDWNTGQIKAMVGGRSLSGRLLYNRATSTRQPGSSIKPIAVYAPALQTGVDGITNWTAGTTIEDSPNYVNGKAWPRNWYSGYKGFVTLRTCVEQSINVCSVKLVNNIGYDASVEFLRKLGISSIVADDYNPAALGLGGMTNGISPIEMTAAYAAFPNGGEYIEPTCYTRILDADGNVLIEKVPETNQAMDPGVAFIMTDILRTTVSRGIAGRAAISGQPAAGKTGTTTDNYDAWFVGVTPQYSAAVWIGNDLNIELTRGSAAAASLWSNVMQKVCSGLPRGTYEKPDNVYSSGGEYYVEGTARSGERPSSGYTDEESEEGVTDENTENPDGAEGTDIPDGNGSGTNDGLGDTTTVPDGIVHEPDNTGNEGSDGNDGSDDGDDRSEESPELPDGVVISD